MNDNNTRLTVPLGRFSILCITPEWLRIRILPRGKAHTYDTTVSLYNMAIFGQPEVAGEGNITLLIGNTATRYSLVMDKFRG